MIAQHVNKPIGVLVLHPVACAPAADGGGGALEEGAEVGVHGAVLHALDVVPQVQVESKV